MQNFIAINKMQFKDSDNAKKYIDAELQIQV